MPDAPLDVEVLLRRERLRDLSVGYAAAGDRRDRGSLLGMFTTDASLIVHGDGDDAPLTGRLRGHACSASRRTTSATTPRPARSAASPATSTTVPARRRRWWCTCATSTVAAASAPASGASPSGACWSTGRDRPRRAVRPGGRRGRRVSPRVELSVPLRSPGRRVAAGAGRGRPPRRGPDGGGGAGPRRGRGDRRAARAAPAGRLMGASAGIVIRCFALIRVVPRRRSSTRARQAKVTAAGAPATSADLSPAPPGGCPCPRRRRWPPPPCRPRHHHGHRCATRPTR